MNQDLLHRAAKLNKKHRTKRRVNRATRLLSLVIVLATAYALMVPAITMNHEVICGMEAHTHTEACYAAEPVLICGQTEEEAHTHTEACFAGTEGYVCGLTEQTPHIHTDECYTQEGELICEQSTGGHIHTQECLGQIFTLVCGREETEGHQHSDACFEEQQVLICGQEEHEHTEDCCPEKSDDSADVETKEQWEAEISEHEFTGDWAENVLAVANLQLGYTESAANFRYADGEKMGYTRYGAWYGDKYGDWSAMFVSFCLYYGGVPESLFPAHDSCEFWAELLKELGRYVPADGNTPRPGDVVFFDTKEHLSEDEPRVPDHVGLVAAVAEDRLYTIEGNVGDSVVLADYAPDDPVILGYGLLPEQEEPAWTEVAADEIGISELTYADERLSATIFVYPQLPEHTELLVEKVDQAEDAAAWETMSAPVLEKLEEEQQAQIGQEVEAAEEDNADSVNVFSVKLLADGQELCLDETYAVGLAATLCVPAMDAETPADTESLRGFALNLEQAPPANATTLQENGQDGFDNTLPGQEEAETALIENADSERIETAPASDAFTAASLDIFAEEQMQTVTLEYEGDGRLRGFALLAPEPAQSDQTPAGLSLLGAGVSGSAGSTGNFTQHKTIDWLGDLHGNSDTDLDDGASAASMKDYYRLYLDAGQYEFSNAIDLLVVLDKSNSMTSFKDMTDSKGNKNQERYKVINEIVNGPDGKNGFIERFLKLNPDNRYAVISFGGAQAGANSDTATKDHALSRSYTKDTKDETTGWRSDYKKIDCTPNDGNEAWGTNYSAAFYRARDMLKQNTSTHKKLMIFISDGVPTFWMDNENTRYGNGSEESSYNYGTFYNGSYATDSYYINTKNQKVTTKERNITVTKARIDELHTAFPDVGMYVIGVSSTLDTTLLNELATDGEDGVFTSLDYKTLIDKFENILYGNTGAFKAVEISDQLSEYVEFHGDNLDLKVTVTENGTTKTLYSRSTCGTTNFTDTTSTAGASGNFKTDNKQDGKPLLKSVSYDAATKTVTAKFNPDIGKLSRTAKYEMSFNVRLSQTAKDTYKANLLDGKDPYNEVKGDAGTDYNMNATSSNKPGFRSNKKAAFGYLLGETLHSSEYDHPVVQTDGSFVNVTVNKVWELPEENQQDVTIRLYAAPTGSATLTPVLDSGGKPIVLTLNEDNGWTTTVKGLPPKNSSGKTLCYYITEDAISGCMPVYDDPVQSMKIDNTGGYTAGKVTLPETATNSVYAGTVTVTNCLGIALPATGGSGGAWMMELGTALFTLGGLLLLFRTVRDDSNRKRRRES